MASPFIEAARVLGASDRRIMMKYVLPNVFALVILGATLRLGFVVLLEASLSFLGYGLPPPFPSWGQMLSLEGREYMRTQPGLAIYPGLAIGLLVFSFNLFGDALRDVLDPRLRGSSSNRVKRTRNRPGVLPGRLLLAETRCSALTLAALVV